jgi:hypothetical protein
MLVKKLLIVACLVGSSMLIGAGPASACDGICTLPIANECVTVGSSGVSVGPGGVAIFPGYVTVHPSECVRRLAG